MIRSIKHDPSLRDTEIIEERTPGDEKAYEKLSNVKDWLDDVSSDGTVDISYFTRDNKHYCDMVITVPEDPWREKQDNIFYHNIDLEDRCDRIKYFNPEYNVEVYTKASECDHPRDVNSYAVTGEIVVSIPADEKDDTAVNEGKHICKKCNEGFTITNKELNMIADLNYSVADYLGDDFLILDTWDDVREIQKRLNPDYHYRDKLDTSVIDEWTDGNWGFSNQFISCDRCNGVIDMNETPNVDYYINYNEFICGNCVRDKKAEKEEYLEYIVNNPKRANTLLLDDDLIAAGFVKLDDQSQNGWYGISDDPKDIYKKLEKDYPDSDILFSVDSASPYAIDFCVFIRKR